MDDTDCYESGFMSYLGYFVNQTETIEEDYAIIWESKMDPVWDKDNRGNYIL